LIEQVVNKLSANTGWFDIIEISGVSTPIQFRNNRLHSVTEYQNSGFGVRVSINGKTGFSYTNDASGLMEAADRAEATSKFGDIEDFELPYITNTDFEPYDPRIHGFDIAAEIDKAEDAMSAILRKFPEANIESRINGSHGKIRIINSNGVDQAYKSSRYATYLSAMLFLDDGSKIEIWEGASALAPASYNLLIEKITDKLDNARINKKTAGGKIAVLASPKATARMIGIVTAGLNAESVSKGISPFAGKIDNPLFSDKLTISDEPDLENSPYSYPFDAEGVAARKKFLVKEGRIKNYITDLKYARKLNLIPEGNGQRGYSTLPHPSFSNIVIDKGADPHTSLLRNIKRGILVDQFIGLGQSNTLTGDFSAGLDLAYLIENGEITGRVKDCMLTDNLFTLLADEIVVSSNREQIGSVLAPYLLFPLVNYTV
jgi:PmbA protein